MTIIGVSVPKDIPTRSLSFIIVYDDNTTRIITNINHRTIDFSNIKNITEKVE